MTVLELSPHLTAWALSLVLLLVSVFKGWWFLYLILVVLGSIVFLDSAGGDITRIAAFLMALYGLACMFKKPKGAA